MKLLLARHGNTFDLNMSPTWVGSKNDLPLTLTGVEQAKLLANALRSAKINLTAIYCGPLKRTLNYAEIIIDELALNYSPVVDSRLNELDYGLWAGLTTQQIIEKFGQDELDQWERYGKWPQKSGWENSAINVNAEISSFAFDMSKQHRPNDNILVISSNGKLRYFLNLISNEYEKRLSDGTLKTKTGNLSEFIYQKNQWQLKFWNEIPQPLLFN